MGIVAFDPVAFVARYPEFATVSAPTLLGYFSEATIYLDNSNSSIVADVTRRALLLNMLTAHVAALYGEGVSGQGAPGTVGRISGASEGSVNVQIQNDYAPGTPQWYQQTKYGSSYWAGTAPYRTMRYVGPSSRCR